MNRKRKVGVREGRFPGPFYLGLWEALQARFVSEEYQAKGGVGKTVYGSTGEA